MAQPDFSVLTEVSKKHVALAVFFSAVLVLSACGKRPSINDLEPPKNKVESSTSDLSPSETIDGVKDGPEPVAKERREKRFILDPLL